MDEPRFHSPLVITIVVATVLLVSLSYVVGYFALSDPIGGLKPRHRSRGYQAGWLATIYQPLASIESAVTGGNVDTIGDPFAVPPP